MNRNRYSMPPALYVATGTDERQWSHLILAVYFRKSPDYYAYVEGPVFKWQSNADNRHDWYGLRVDLELSAGDGKFPARLRHVAKLTEKLLPETEGVCNWSPRSVVARLHAAKIFRGAYDSRLSRHVLESESPGAHYGRWLDDWTRYDTGAERDGCCVSGLATDDADAQRALTREWGESIGQGSYGNPERFASWIKAGKPVRQVYHDKSPVFTPLDELLHTPPPAAADPLLLAA